MVAVEREWRAKLSIVICVTEREQRGREMYDKCEEREADFVGQWKLQSRMDYLYSGWSKGLFV